MTKMKPVIVIPAFRRATALSRLLESILSAHYSAPPTVILSLEGNASSDVVNVAKRFHEVYSDCVVVKHKIQLGLRDHIIECADWSQKFGSVILLEEDLIVDKYFYHYATSALDFYKSQKEIAGIALYAPEINEYADLPFSPLSNGYSTYFMQTPCSWGQCWTADQWANFKNWYLNNQKIPFRDTERLPGRLAAWPASSWKKHFGRFLVDQNKRFVYPYSSYSSNCSDSGGHHIINGTDRFQVSLPCPTRNTPDLSFCPIDNQEVSYDSYMEFEGQFLPRTLGVKREELEVDLFGIKSKSVVTSKKYVFSATAIGIPIATFPMAFRPVELNALYPMKSSLLGGKIIFAKSAEVQRLGASRDMIRLSYFYNTNFFSRVLMKEVLRAAPRAVLRFLLLKLNSTLAKSRLRAQRSERTGKEYESD